MTAHPLAEAAALFTLAFVTRLFPHPPNMTALSAVAIRARARFGSKGVMIPLAALLATDAFIGFYDWRLLASVYGSFALIALLSRFLGGTPSFTRTLGASTGGALLFFLVTNAAVWALSSWYPKTLAGLLACYAAGVPFLYTMLAGDLLYGVALLYLLPRVLAHSPHFREVTPRGWKYI